MRLVRAARACLLAAALLTPAAAFAANGPGMSTDLVRTMLLLTLLAVAPAIFISMTSFVRIVVPALNAVNSQALKPLMAGSVSVEQAIEKGSGPLRTFMLAQTRDGDIEAIYAIAKAPVPDRPEQVDLLKLTPAFILNELRVSFTIGFVILLPFLLIDLVVASILLALGMMMVPPSTISLPIKILMFVLIDGWGLILQGVLGSFR